LSHTPGQGHYHNPVTDLITDDIDHVYTDEVCHIIMSIEPRHRRLRTSEPMC